MFGVVWSPWNDGLWFFESDDDNEDKVYRICSVSTISCHITQHKTVVLESKGKRGKCLQNSNTKK